MIGLKTLRRAALVIGLALTLACVALPQESAAKPETQTEENPMTGWKWANFAILAIGLGYLLGKALPPLFRKQSDEIHAALAEAAKMKHEAGIYAANVEARLSNIQREIASLRESAHSEMAAESERIRRETARHIEKIREQSTQEIALMTRGAKEELQKYAAELAIGLAGERIRSRMNPDTQENLVNGFLSDLGRRAASRN
ncbi:MAG TPA: ATP synthase F0 subunit B [Bryobacteraceae bacterium]|nr:ATP synthase F0 subunit B [Bryobacteraceae bacterium]